MINEQILKSWYEDNAVRKFPLLETSKDDIPRSFMIGMEISIPYGMTVSEGAAVNPLYTLHVSNIVIGTSEVAVTISAGESGGAVAFVAVPTSQLTTPQGWALAGVSNANPLLQGVSGTVYFGYPDTFLHGAGTYTLTPSEGEIEPECIHPYPDSFRGLVVNGRMLTGDITLVEGDNIRLSFDEADRLVIAYEPPEVLGGLYTRADLLAALSDYYGAPVTTINGIAPNVMHDFTIDAGEESCVEITSLEHGIRIANTCANPCCDPSQLANIAEAIQVLNTRAARLASYLEATSTNLNALQNELGILKLGLKQQ